MNPDAINEQSLCLSCGLCCDGTLFAIVPLREEDSATALQARGIALQKKEDNYSFKQPCTAYRQNCCQIYADRPANCQKYRCAVLRNYERGDISRSDAQARISRALMLKEAVRNSLASIVANSHELSMPAVLKVAPQQEAMVADPVLLQTWGSAMMQISALLDCLQTHFEPPWIKQENDPN